MRLAYADPVYLGMSRRYPEHPESHVWDNLDTHAQLLATLDRDYDGWAYSCSATTLRQILTVAPEGIRIGSWNKPFCAFKRNVRIAYSWEPVLFKPGRDSSKLGASVGRDSHSANITLRRGLTGAKPETFCRWVLDLMGYVEGDEVLDLFPGTGVMQRVLDQGVLAL